MNPVESSLFHQTNKEDMQNLNFRKFGEELKVRSPMLWKKLEVVSLN